MYHKWIEFNEFLIYFEAGGLCSEAIEKNIMRVNLLC